MSTLKHVISSTSILAISNGIARVASFVSVVIMTTHLSLYQYGVLTLALTLSGPILTLCNLGLDELIMADVSRYIGEKKYDHAKKLMSTYFSMQWLLLPVLGAAVYVLRPYLQERYGELLYTHVYVMLYYVALQLARTGINTFLNIHSRFLAIAKAQVFEPIIRCLCLVGLLWANHITVEYVLWTYIVGSMVSIVVVFPDLFELLKKYKGYTSIKKNMLYGVVRAHGKWQGMLQIISSAINSLRYHFINVIISTEAVALFSVAQSMYSVLTSLLPVKTVIAPLIARKLADKEHMRSFITKASKYTFLTYVLAMSAALVSAPFIVTFFFPKYIAAIILFELMVLRLPLNMFSVIQAPLMTAFKEQKYMSGLGILNLLLVITVTPVFLYMFGIVGTIIESLFTVGIVIYLRERLLHKKYHISTFSPRSFFSFDNADLQVLQEVWIWIKKMGGKVGFLGKKAI